MSKELQYLTEKMVPGNGKVELRFVLAMIAL